MSPIATAPQAVEVRVAVIEVELRQVRADLGSFRAETSDALHEIRSAIGQRGRILGADLGEMLRLAAVLGAVLGGVWWMRPSRDQVRDAVAAAMNERTP